MSHYANLAALAFRVVSMVLLIYALLGLLVIARVAGNMVAAGGASSIVLLPALAGLVIAILLYLTAPFLGRFAASGLGTPERTA